MRFATLRVEEREQAAVFVHDEGWAHLDAVDPSLTGNLLTLIKRQWSRDRLAELHEKASDLESAILTPTESAVFAPPYRHPRKIWGIGLNYADHASDLDESAPDEPASFIKGDHTIIGFGDEIILPKVSRTVTTEAELGVVIGREADTINRAAVPDAVFGVTCILDQTAEDILRRNPRFLTRSKNFTTFFSFGPEVVTLDEALGDIDLQEVRVDTVIDGEVKRSNTVANMMHQPWDLVADHSEVMPWYPGDILSTGTPGAAEVSGGELAEARIGGIAVLSNPVASRD